MIGAVAEVTQDPEKAGNAMKILSLRLRGMKGELQDIGEETDENVENISKMQGQILKFTHGKVNIFNDAGEFRSTYDIMTDIAEVYDQLSSTEQADLLETIAGKHRANDVAALIQNIGNAISMEQYAMNSAGSATKENEKYVESLQGKVNQLITAWQKFANEFMQSDMLKGLVGGLTTALDFVTDIVDLFGSIPAIIGTIAGVLTFTEFKDILPFYAIENKDKFTGIDARFGWAERLSSLKGEGQFSLPDNFGESIQKNTAYLNEYKNALISGSGYQDAFNDVMIHGSNSAKQYAQELKDLYTTTKQQYEVQSEGIVAAKEKMKEISSNDINKELEKREALDFIANQASDNTWVNKKNLIKGYNGAAEKGTKSQVAFAGAVSKTNSLFGRYLASLNGAKASMLGYALFAMRAQASTLALNTAMMAGNMVAVMLIGTIISGAISAIDKAIVTSEELAEKVDEVTGKYKEQQDTLRNAKSLVDKVAPSDGSISRYQELAKGVNSLGQNIGLTSDEYSEYQGIVSEIASMFPELVSGYDEQGNAILSCKDNVELLTQAYKEMAIAANNELLNNTKDISKDVLNDTGNLNSNTKDYGDIPIEYDEYSETFSNVVSSNSERMNALKNVLESEDLTSALNEYVKENSGVEKAIVKTLEHEGLKREEGQSNRDFILSSLQDQNARAKIQNVVNSYYNELEKAVSPLRDIVSAQFNNAFLEGTTSLDDSAKEVVSRVVNGISAETLKSLNYQGGGDAITDYVDSILAEFERLKGNGGIGVIKGGFELETKFNDGKLTFGEYKKQLDNVVSFIDSSNLDEEVKSQLKLSLNVDEVQKQYDNLIEKLTSNGATPSLAEDMVNSFSQSELKVAVDWILKPDVDLSKMSIEDIRKKVKEDAKIQDAISFPANIEVDTGWLETLNGALGESASAAGLTSDSITKLKNRYSDLDGYDPSKLFEKTANGVKVNREELDKLESKYNDLTKTDIKNHLETLVNEYNRLTADIDKTSNAAERAKLISEREGYANKIEELATYQAQLEGVTGAYQRWIDAQSGPEDYEGYESVAKSYKDIKEEIDRGFIGNKSKQYIDLLSGEDLEGASIDEYAKAWNRLDDKVTSTGYSIKDFFTVNDDGDITATGIDRFFESLQSDFKGSVANFNKETGKWEYDFSKDNLKKIQDEWGVGIEAIQLMLEAAGDAGYDVDWDGIFDNFDLNTSDFETLVLMAETAQATFNKIDGVKEVDFNFKASGISEATSEVEKAKSAYLDLITNDNGTINLKAEGAEEMRFMLSALLVQKQQLEDSKIAINIDTSGFDESQADIAAAINAVQNFREKYKNLEIAVSTGDGIEEAKTELRNAMVDFDNLGENGIDIAAKLVLGEGSDASSLQTELQNAVSSVGTNTSINVGANLDETAVGNLNSQLEANFTPEATVKITGIDSSLVGTYETTEKTTEGTVTWKNDESLVIQFQNAIHNASGFVKWEDNSDNLTLSGWSATGTITWTSGNNVEVKVVKKADGTAHVQANGTAHANGSASGRAFAQGNWGTKGSGVALGGELGQELVVRDGRWFTIGDNGAEFFKYQPNDIIFNAGQTKQIFEQGKIVNGRTRGMIANANGTAFAEGNVFAKGKKNSNSEIAWEMKKARTWFDGITDAQVKRLGYKNVKTVKQFYNAIENGTINPKFGNINMDNREVIRWNKTNKEKYKDGLKSWGHYNEVDSGAYDTVYGATTRYGEHINGKGVQVAYSPIVVDENGKASKFLTTDEVNNYINKIVRKAYEQDGKFKQSTILSLDNLGIIAGTDTSMNYGENGTGNTAVIKSALMHFAGKYGAIQLAKKNKKKSKYDGSAFVDGTSKAKNKDAMLVGELGTEMLVRNGRWYTVGENGAEFLGHKKNDIIFNAEQTEQLLGKGKISSGKQRGTMADYNGTAFASGNAFVVTEQKEKKKKEKIPTWQANATESDFVSKRNNKKKSTKTTKKKSTSDDTTKKSSKDKDKEKFDWIERAIKRLERAISKLDTTIDNAAEKWSTRNKKLEGYGDHKGKHKGKIDYVKDKIDVEEQGAARYKKEAKKSATYRDAKGKKRKLSKSLIKKIENGTIDIQELEDTAKKEGSKDNSKLEAIKEYQQWFDKFKDCKQAARELRVELQQLYKLSFDNVVKEYEGLLSVIEHKANVIDKMIARSEARGNIVSDVYYKNSNNVLKEEESNLLEEYNKLVQKRKNALYDKKNNPNGIKEGSEEDIEMVKQINDVWIEILDKQNQQIENLQKIREIENEIFELKREAASGLIEESDFFIDLFSIDKLYDENNGQLTKQGWATMGLHGMNYNVNMSNADEYAKKIAEADKKMKEAAKNGFDSEFGQSEKYWYDEKNKWIGLQRDSIKGAKEEKEAIRDMVEEGINVELDALQKLIDKKQEEIDSEKD